jgi:hypothetical protein
MFLSATLGQVTLDQLIRHARSFGTECVFETGEHGVTDGPHAYKAFQALHDAQVAARSTVHSGRGAS